MHPQYPTTIHNPSPEQMAKLAGLGLPAQPIPLVGQMRPESAETSTTLSETDMESLAGKITSGAATIHEMLIFTAASGAPMTRTHFIFGDVRGMLVAVAGNEQAEEANAALEGVSESWQRGATGLPRTKVRALTLDGLTYDPDLVNQVRNGVINLRDRMIQAEKNDDVLVLSLTAVMLGDYITRILAPEVPANGATTGE